SNPAEQHMRSRSGRDGAFRWPAPPTDSRCPHRRRRTGAPTVVAFGWGGVAMRFESSVTTVSWIPSEAVTGMPRSVFDLVKMTHYDTPPPDSIDDLDAMAAHDAFRFANRVRAWIEVQDGRITTAAYAPDSGVVMGATTVRLGIKDATFTAGIMPEIRRDPVIS